MVDGMGQVLILFGYFLVLALVSDQDPIPILVVLGSTLVYPPIMFGFLWMRKNATRHCQMEQEKDELSMITSVTSAVTNYRVVADYFKRPVVVSQIEENVDLFNEAVSDTSALRDNNE